MSPPSARIRLLPETVVNRIAAGEVIERPAAAVKELVENALDAGATRISVVVETGGIDRIEVVDDGGGMDADGLALAVQRHATSKLADDDLVRIATLGFRGEALPSIGAAARLPIVPGRQAGRQPTPSGWKAGGSGRWRRRAGAAGTRVVMRDLFYATPARRKFLKHRRGRRCERPRRRCGGWRWRLQGWRFGLEIEGGGVRLAGAGSCRAGGARCWAAMRRRRAPLEETRGVLRLAGFRRRHRR